MTAIRSYILFMNEMLDKQVSFSYNKTQGDTTPEWVSAVFDYIGRIPKQ